MNEVTQILDAAESGDTLAAEHLLPGAYAGMRLLAASRLAAESGAQTLQPTALVHEAWLKLAGPDGKGRTFASAEDFFAAAAQAMRRILIDNARRKRAPMHGGNQRRTLLDNGILDPNTSADDVLTIDEALIKLEAENADIARIVKLRFYAGMSIPETASVLGVSPSTVDRSWRAAKAWLYREMTEGTSSLR
ncbi:MAG: ECF-type sigma factor [Verrucomicrobiales bacterium]